MKLGCAICLWVLGAVAVLGAPAASADPLFPPGGFRLEAGNGYQLRAISYDGDPQGERDALILFVGRKGAGATYFVLRRVEVTETTIAADLGPLGSIDLHFVPSGKPEKEHASCDFEQVEFESGFYEGQVDCEGEEGYTEIHASRAPGELQLALNLLCTGGPAVEGFGGDAPGASLRVRRDRPKGAVSLEVKTNSHTRPAYFRASIEERSPGLAIIRGASATGAAASFAFDVPAQSARLAPPRPFAGVAHFDSGNRSPGRLRGGLTVDFPGRSNVSLAGTRGSLSRYVANPSHPFRPLLSRPLEWIPSR
jgi:hypothetical protein